MTTEDKARSLKKFLDSNEPHILVPRSYIKNELSQSVQVDDSYFQSFKNQPSVGFDSEQDLAELSIQERSSNVPRAGHMSSLAQEPMSLKAHQNNHHLGDYSQFGNYSSNPRGDATTGNRRRNLGKNLSSLFKKQVSGSANNATTNRKKTTRLFNV